MSPLRIACLMACEEHPKNGILLSTYLSHCVRYNQPSSTQLCHSLSRQSPDSTCHFALIQRASSKRLTLYDNMMDIHTYTGAQHLSIPHHSFQQSPQQQINHYHNHPVSQVSQSNMHHQHHGVMSPVSHHHHMSHVDAGQLQRANSLHHMSRAGSCKSFECFSLFLAYFFLPSKCSVIKHR